MIVLLRCSINSLSNFFLQSWNVSFHLFWKALLPLSMTIRSLIFSLFRILSFSRVLFRDSKWALALSRIFGCFVEEGLFKVFQCLICCHTSLGFCGSSNWVKSPMCYDYESYVPVQGGSVAGGRTSVVVGICDPVSSFVGGLLVGCLWVFNL